VARRPGVTAAVEKLPTTQARGIHPAQEPACALDSRVRVPRLVPEETLSLGQARPPVY